MAITFFKDLSLDFTPHPVSGDVRPITNDTAIKRSLKNLLLTPVGSKPFYPTYGTNVQDFLFRSPDPLSKYDLEKSLFDSISRFEPRVTVTRIDAIFSDNGLDVDIHFIIKNTGTASSVTTTLTRTA